MKQFIKLYALVNVVSFTFMLPIGFKPEHIVLTALTVTLLTITLDRVLPKEII